MPRVANLASDADDLRLRGYKGLGEQLALKLTSINRKALLNDWLLRKAVGLSSRQSWMCNAFRLIKKSQWSIGDVMEHVPMSWRQLERKFQFEVGIAWQHVCHKVVRPMSNFAAESGFTPAHL